MRQITARLRPWAPTMLGTGLFATLAESLQEGDRTSLALLFMSLVGFLLLVRVKHGLTRGEVRAEIDAGIRARVKSEAMIVPMTRVIPSRVVRHSPDPEEVPDEDDGRTVEIHPVKEGTP